MRLFYFCSLSVLTVMLLSLAPAGARPPTYVIPPAPPAPVISTSVWQSELRARRNRVENKIGQGNILVLFSTRPRVYTNDTDYPYRQENNLFYLTRLNQQNITLVLASGPTGPVEILFLPRRNPAEETWTGHTYSPQEAARISGIQEIWDTDQFAPLMESLRAHKPYTPGPTSVMNRHRDVNPSFEPLLAAVKKGTAGLYFLQPGPGDDREYVYEKSFAAGWTDHTGGFTLHDATPVFASLRQLKSPLEISLMQHAVDISVEAHRRAQAAANRANWEYEIAAPIDYTFRMRNADHWSYPSIVGAGPSATTLHHEEDRDPVHPGDLVLIDAGAEYAHYTSDVTRTFPARGHFSPAQEEIYNTVLRARDAAAARIRPGATLAEIHRAATQVLRDGLVKLGLLTEANPRMLRIWFPHYTSHWLGMNVHDVGTGGSRLEPGMVFTVEPGIYIRPDALDNLPHTPEMEKFIAAVRPAFEKYRGIGVRIEDDMLVTPEGYRCLSNALPRTIPDIEASLARLAAD